MGRQPVCSTLPSFQLGTMHTARVTVTRTR